MKKLNVFIIVALVSLSGCISPLASKIDQVISAHNAVTGKVKLGDHKNKVLSILLPTQKNLPENNKKLPDKYIKKGVRVEIYYMRSGRQPDGLTTDDEFTPYVFNNDKLVAIGWASIGGPKTHGKVTPRTNVNVQPTIIY